MPVARNRQRPQEACRLHAGFVVVCHDPVPGFDAQGGKHLGNLSRFRHQALQRSAAPDQPFIVEMHRPGYVPFPPVGRGTKVDDSDGRVVDAGMQVLRADHEFREGRGLHECPAGERPGLRQIHSGYGC